MVTTGIQRYLLQTDGKIQFLKHHDRLHHVITDLEPLFLIQGAVLNAQVIDLSLVVLVLRHFDLEPMGIVSSSGGYRNILLNQMIRSVAEQGVSGG